MEAAAEQASVKPVLDESPVLEHDNLDPVGHAVLSAEESGQREGEERRRRRRGRRGGRRDTGNAAQEGAALESEETAEVDMQAEASVAAPAAGQAAVHVDAEAAAAVAVVTETAAAETVLAAAETPVTAEVVNGYHAAAEPVPTPAAAFQAAQAEQPVFEAPPAAVTPVETPAPIETPVPASAVFVAPQVTPAIAEHAVASTVEPVVPTVTTQVAEVASAPVQVGAARISVEALQPMLASAGLTWVNTDSAKLKAAQESAAQHVEAPRAPRVRKVLPPSDSTPMVQVETAPGSQSHQS